MSRSRRQFLAGAAAAAALGFIPRGLAATAPLDLAKLGRVRGLVFGSALGDAIGGPIEFQPQDAAQGLADPPKVWRMGEKLDAASRAVTAERLRLRSYHHLRPGAESYGQWNVRSAPGTITDDTRHKLVLLHALHAAHGAGRWPMGVGDLARSYLDWPSTSAVVGREGYEELAADWLEEWQFAARWELGERDLSRALPPSRMWQSLPTCCGQMTLLPLAALFAGQPEKAYLAAHHLGFFDNGFGKDLNAALIAGLAQALATPVAKGGSAAAFEKVLAAMRATDPLRFGKIRWSERAVDRWLNLALRFAEQAKGEPARLFASLEAEFLRTTKWEAQVPFVVAFSCFALAEYDSLAALQLSLEWGHDTDSYAQLVGAFAGALHGVELFQADWRGAVASRLQADHGVDLEQECRFLLELQMIGESRSLVEGA